MKDCVYVLYNRLSCRYEAVISFPTDAVMISAMQKGKIDRSRYEVCKIGEIDLSTGILNSTPPVRIEIPDVEENPLPSSEVK